MLGSPRTTVDLDIVYARDEENLARRETALEPLQPRLRGAPPRLPFVLDSATLTRGLNFTLTVVGRWAGLSGLRLWRVGWCIVA